MTDDVTGVEPDREPESAAMEELIGRSGPTHVGDRGGRNGADEADGVVNLSSALARGRSYTLSTWDHWTDMMDW